MRKIKNPVATIEAARDSILASVEQYIAEQKLLGRKLQPTTLGYYAAKNPGCYSVLKKGGLPNIETLRELVAYINRKRAAYTRAERQIINSRHPRR